jgi:hypothetical protein
MPIDISYSIVYIASEMNKSTAARLTSTSLPRSVITTESN